MHGEGLACHPLPNLAVHRTARKKAPPMDIKTVPPIFSADLEGFSADACVIPG